MPPPVMTNVMPMLTTPMTAASRRIVSDVVDAGEPVARGDDADDAEQDERDDESEVAGAEPASQPADARLRRAGAAAAAPAPSLVPAAAPSEVRGVSSLTRRLLP